MTLSTLTPAGVHCPQCGSPSIVEYKPTVYHCLKCGFEKDLSATPEPETGGFGSGLLAMLAGFGLVLAVML